MGIESIVLKGSTQKILGIIVFLSVSMSSSFSLVLSADSSCESFFSEEHIMHHSFQQTVTLSEESDFVRVSMNPCSYVMNPGKPLLPKKSHVFTFPLGTRITNVSIDITSDHVHLSKPIQPALVPLPTLSLQGQHHRFEKPVFDATFYETDCFYPSIPFTIQKNAGLHHNERMLFVTVTVFAQYNPSEHLLIIPESVDINLSYQHPQISSVPSETFDLLVITDERFTSTLQPLVDHKNSIGIQTTMHTVQEILPQFNGRDDAEDVKLFIKHAIETWDITYVLLAGGRKGQSYEWFVPSRRTMNTQSQWESGYESDLYFADIYTIENDTVVFEDWDSNNNDMFAEWSMYGDHIDTIDYYPDVYVGRLPFRYSTEITPVVNKIIAYETMHDTSFFDKAFVVGGDTFPPSRGAPMDHVYEGEEVTGVTATLLENAGFSVEKLWLSLDAWDNPTDVIKQLNTGCGFVHFAGHGNPASWGNHPPDDTEDVFYDGLTVFSMGQLENKNELPIAMVGGCHNAQFNVTVRNVMWILRNYGIKESFFTYPFRFFYMDWIPRDFCSWLVFHPDGGAIASIGNTGLGYGSISEIGDLDGDNITEPDCVETYGGWIETRFFDAYARQNHSVLGMVHGQAIIDYIQIIGNVGVFPKVGDINDDPVGRQTIEGWALIGDPSLHIGGIDQEH